MTFFEGHIAWTTHTSWRSKIASAIEWLDMTQMPTSIEWFTHYRMITYRRMITTLFLQYF